MQVKHLNLMCENVNITHEIMGEKDSLSLSLKKSE